MSLEDIFSVEENQNLKLLTHFEQIKFCKTPEDMVIALNGNARRFCPKEYTNKPDECKEPCGRCITNWLKERG